MDKFIKVGIGVMILDDNKVLLGHRSKDKKDTGGIFEIDCWTLPGGKYAIHHKRMIKYVI